MNTKERQVIYSEIASTHSYEEVWDFQKHLQAKIIRLKRSEADFIPGYFLLCEHAPVYTLGKSGKLEHLQVSLSTLSDQQVEFFKINRGGDITFHGPGQITGYPILDLSQYYQDLHRYVRDIEEVIIQSIARFGLKGKRVEGYTGVWLEDGRGRRKICAIGIHMSRWVSMHGFALNVNTELRYFDQIIPCGIKEEDTSVTSLQAELGRRIEMQEVKKTLRQAMSERFDFNYANEALSHQTFLQ